MRKERAVVVMKLRYLACGAIGMLALVVNLTYSQEPRTSDGGAQGFTMRCPAEWGLDGVCFSGVVESLPASGVAMGDEGPRARHGRIAFRSERDGNWEIYAMNLDGSDVRRLTNHPARDDMPRWSPDGKQIVFRSERDGRQEIYVMNADGSGQKRLTNEAAKDSEPGFAPDGKKILFSSKRGGGWDLYTMNADGRDQRRVSAEPLKGGGGRFSPDGRRIVFASMRDGDPEIYVMRADGTHVTRLTRNPGYDGSAAWSPSGKSIAFASTRAGEYDIYVMEADGSNPEKVTLSGSNESGPAFVDEHTLVFFSDREEHCEIYRIDLRTKDCTRLTHSPGYDGIPDVWVERESGK